jgi:hypothetical protein
MRFDSFQCSFFQKSSPRRGELTDEPFQRVSLRAVPDPSESFVGSP